MANSGEQIRSIEPLSVQAGPCLHGGAEIGINGCGLGVVFAGAWRQGGCYESCWMRGCGFEQSKCCAQDSSAWLSQPLSLQIPAWSLCFGNHWSFASSNRNTTSFHNNIWSISVFIFQDCLCQLLQLDPLNVHINKCFLAGQNYIQMGKCIQCYHLDAIPLQLFDIHRYIHVIRESQNRLRTS